MSHSLRWIACIAAAVCCSAPLPRAPASAAPNIVLIVADDLGWSDTSNPLTNMGHPSDYYETPALDRLAAEGMAFTNAYTCGPNCAPTRAAMLTGLYAPRPTNNIYLVGHLNRGGDETMLVGPAQGLPSGAVAIPVEALTFAEHLRQNAGYRTAHVGKFHVTQAGVDGAAQIVAEHGFDENFGGTSYGAPTAYHAHDGQFGAHIGPELDRFAVNYTQQYVDGHIKPFSHGTTTAAVDALVGAEKHVSDALADAAIDFMQRSKNSPFLLQFHPYAVHAPIGNRQARPDLLQKYRAKKRGAQDRNPSFAALIEGLDQSVARLIHFLETTRDPADPGHSLAANTLVIFYSDNGGKQPQSNNGPLKGQKGELDEGGIRVPMIVWSGDPELVDGGSVNATPVASVDFFPTFAALAGAAPPAHVTLDGEDLSGIFADAEARLNREALYWHLPGYLVGGGRNLRPASVIRSGPWKLVYRYETHDFLLFDLEQDLSEAHDAAADNPEVVQRLGRMLMNWLAATQAPLPRLRAGMLTVDGKGWAYADGKTSAIERPLIVEAGDEVPFVLPTTPSPQ